jgi:hypothetical protein
LSGQGLITHEVCEKDKASKITAKQDEIFPVETPVARYKILYRTGMTNIIVTSYLNQHMILHHFGTK